MGQSSTFDVTNFLSLPLQTIRKLNTKQIKQPRFIILFKSTTRLLENRYWRTWSF